MYVKHGHVFFSVHVSLEIENFILLYRIWHNGKKLFQKDVINEILLKVLHYTTTYIQLYNLVQLFNFLNRIID